MSWSEVAILIIYYRTASELSLIVVKITLSVTDTRFSQVRSSRGWFIFYFLQVKTTQNYVGKKAQFKLIPHCTRGNTTQTHPHGCFYIMHIKINLVNSVMKPTLPKPTEHWQTQYLHSEATCDKHVAGKKPSWHLTASPCVTAMSQQNLTYLYTHCTPAVIPHVEKVVVNPVSDDS